MPEPRLSPWQCQHCALVFPTSEAMRRHFEVEEVLYPSRFAGFIRANILQTRAMQLLDEFKSAWSHARQQPLIYLSEGSNVPEEDLAVDAVHYKSALRPPSKGVDLQCPLAECYSALKDKRSLNRHYYTRIHSPEQASSRG